MTDKWNIDQNSPFHAQITNVSPLIYNSVQVGISNMWLEVIGGHWFDPSIVHTINCFLPKWFTDQYRTSLDKVRA
jgi:hypothetical protein